MKINDCAKFAGMILIAGGLTAAVVTSKEKRMSNKEANREYAAQNLSPEEFKKAADECDSWIDFKAEKKWAQKVEEIKLKSKMDSIYWQGYKRAIDSINAKR